MLKQTNVVDKDILHHLLHLPIRSSLKSCSQGMHILDAGALVYFNPVGILEKSY